MVKSSFLSFDLSGGSITAFGPRRGFSGGLGGDALLHGHWFFESQHGIYLGTANTVLSTGYSYRHPLGERFEYAFNLGFGLSVIPVGNRGTTYFALIQEANLNFRLYRGEGNHGLNLGVWITSDWVPSGTLNGADSSGELVGTYPGLMLRPYKQLGEISAY